LPNRRAMDRLAERELRRRDRYPGAIAIAVIDVDHFKAINDRYGHAGGDLALQHLVATLRSGIRDCDLLGRLGGEEFCVVLPAAWPTGADDLAERLRSRVEASRLPFGEREIAMTISIGLAMRQDTDRSIDQIVARADVALYQAKADGRNRVARHASAVAA
jgi:two-component system cell cycle response regulator